MRVEPDLGVRRDLGENEKAIVDAEVEEAEVEEEVEEEFAGLWVVGDSTLCRSAWPATCIRVDGRRHARHAPANPSSLSKFDSSNILCGDSMGTGFAERAALTLCEKLSMSSCKAVLSPPNRIAVVSKVRLAMTPQAIRFFWALEGDEKAPSRI